MEEIVYHLNLNYELFLSGSNKEIKGANWFDHIFFFINKNPKAILKTHYNFDDEYLSYLQEFKVSSVKKSSKGKSIPWWGSCKDIEKEKLFNSKITMSKLGLDKNWIPIPTVLSFEDALKRLEYPMISRDEWGVSGRGVKVLRSRSDFKENSKKSVYSNFVNKLKDYGITFNLEKKTYFIVENYIDKYGQFKGGEIQSVDDSIGEENFKKVYRIKEHLVQLGAVDTIQIDTFSYEGGFHPFVEVNYRKTMGLMVHALTELFDYCHVSWGIVNFKKSKSFKEVLHHLAKFNTKVVLLSPVDRFLSVAFLSGEQIDGMKKIKELEKFLSEI